MFLNHLMLRWFGASYFVLRLPSGIAYFLGLSAGFFLLGNLNFSFLVRLLFLPLLGLSQLNLEHGGEARPYILLQAGVLGFLWAWQRLLAGKRLGLTALGAVSVLGILSHPFFVAYASLTVLLTPVFLPEAHGFAKQVLRSRGTLVRFALVALMLAVLFLVVGKYSWFQTFGHKFQYDPFSYIGREKNLFRFMIGTFYFPFGKVALPILVLQFGFVIWWRKHIGIGPLFRWVLFLATLLVATQGLLVWQVLKSEYWLLQRQWIAGGAIAILLLVFLNEAFVRFFRIRERALDFLVMFLAIGILLGMAWQVKKNLEVSFPPVVALEDAGAYRAGLEARGQLEIQDYLNLAHLNLLQGGPVWSIFQRYYYDALSPP